MGYFTEQQIKKLVSAFDQEEKADCCRVLGKEDRFYYLYAETSLCLDLDMNIEHIWHCGGPYPPLTTKITTLIIGATEDPYGKFIYQGEGAKVLESFYLRNNGTCLCRYCHNLYLMMKKRLPEEMRASLRLNGIQCIVLTEKNTPFSRCYPLVYVLDKENSATIKRFEEVG